MSVHKITWMLAAALLAAGCGHDSTTPSATVDASEMPADQVLFGLHHVMTKDGVRTAVLDSDTAYMKDEGRTFDLRVVRLRFFNESGQESGTLTSRTGEYNADTGVFVARGNAVLVTQGQQGPRRLESEELHYDTRRDQLWSDLPFTLTEGGRVSRGTSFRTDSRFENWTVTQPKTTGGLPQDGKPGP